MAGASKVVPSARIRTKRVRRKAEILKAALRPFREKGYHGTTLDDIAGLVGIRNTALYHYFPDKETILYECHRESLQEVTRVIREAVARFDTATERLTFIIQEHVRVMTESLEGSPLAFEVTALSPVRRRRIVAARDRYEQGLREIIQQGVQSGEFRPTSPKVAAFVILGAINWIARWYRPAGTIGTSDLGRAFADHLVGGLTCR